MLVHRQCSRRTNAVIVHNLNHKLIAQMNKLQTNVNGLLPKEQPLESAKRRQMLQIKAIANKLISQKQIVHKNLVVHMWMVLAYHSQVVQPMWRPQLKNVRPFPTSVYQMEQLALKQTNVRILHKHNANHHPAPRE